jgi:FkbM family methyltransferase
LRPEQNQTTDGGENEEMFKRVIVRYIRPRLDGYTYSVRRGLIRGLRRKGGFGFVPSGKLTREEKFLTELEWGGLTIYDIGGWEGVYTLFFARAAGNGGKVFTFEPHPRNYRRILENISLNGFKNVEVIPIALGSHNGRAKLGSDAVISGEAHIVGRDATEVGPGGHTFEVEVDLLDNQISKRGLPPPDFIKVDVEGMELEVLHGMWMLVTQRKPKLWVEIHTQDSIRASQVVDWLLEAGYLIFHVEGRAKITSSAVPLHHSDHLYCV